MPQDNDLIFLPQSFDDSFLLCSSNGLLMWSNKWSYEKSWRGISLYFFLLCRQYKLRWSQGFISSKGFVFLVLIGAMLLQINGLRSLILTILLFGLNMKTSCDYRVCKVNSMISSMHVIWFFLCFSSVFLERRIMLRII